MAERSLTLLKPQGWCALVDSKALPLIFAQRRMGMADATCVSSLLLARNSIAMTIDNQLSHRSIWTPNFVFLAASASILAMPLSPASPTIVGHEGKCRPCKLASPSVDFLGLANHAISGLGCRSTHGMVL
jgi:hypothetical protein